MKSRSFKGIAILARKFFTVGLLIFFMPFDFIHAQLFPGLEGEDLIEAIQDEFTPTLVLNDNQVKDTLYAKVFIRNDSVHCIYSGLAHDLPGGVDPSQWIYESGTETNSMNLEHSWPQSKGAGDGTNGNRDMHHLYPSRTAINGDRGDFPFVDIADQTTQKWYYLNIETGIKPASNIDFYSEYKSGGFEPRESVKGDIARAMFYFWTIYREDAVAADPLFFEVMDDQLCVWHESDPVDADELLRSHRIAPYQDEKDNPFVLDCSLAQRTYCPGLDPCEMVAVDPVSGTLMPFHWNAADLELTCLEDDGRNWQMLICDILGKKIINGEMGAGQKIRLDNLGQGIFFLTAWNKSRQIFHQTLILSP